MIIVVYHNLYSLIIKHLDHWCDPVVRSGLIDKTCNYNLIFSDFYNIAIMAINSYSALALLTTPCCDQFNKSVCIHLDNPPKVQ